MTVHNHEAMTHEHGLQDNCPRCQEYVKDPTQLDAENLRRCWRYPMTQTDARAQSTLYAGLVLAQTVISAFQWEEFDPNQMSIIDFEPATKLTVDELFDIFHGKAVAR